eukprot:jgi/Botrbrau1/11364/Bobra.0038s0112.1
MTNVAPQQTSGAMENSSDSMIYHESDLMMRSHAASPQFASASKHQEAASASTRGTLLGDSNPKSETCLSINQKPEEVDIADSRTENDQATSEYSSSESSSSGHSDPRREVILRIEHVHPRDYKTAIVGMWVTFAIGTVFLLIHFASILRRDGDRLPHQAVFILNIVVASMCFIALSITGFTFLLRVIRCNLENRYWSLRRFRSATLHGTECLIQWINIIFYLIPNINVLADVCNFLSPLVGYCALVRWTCWNTMFLIFCIQAQNINPWRRGIAAAKKEGMAAFRRGKETTQVPVDKIFMDAPVWYHWRICPIWVLLEAFILWAAFRFSLSDDAMIWEKDGGSCDTFANSVISCPIRRDLLALSICMDVLAFASFLLYVFLIARAVLSLRRKPYHEHKMGNLIVRMQMRMRSATMVMFVLTVTLLWYLKPDSCRSYVYIWYGMLPVQVVQTGAAVVYTSLVTPADPKGVLPVLRVWLQEFAWTEAELPKKIKDRSRNRPNCSDLQKEPMFCFQTMINCLYWSCLVYDYEEALDSPLSLDVGMSLYGLEHSELFWEKAMDTKMLMAWSCGTIIVAFRGTASVQNAMADLRAWQTIHPPSRGSIIRKPKVHEGFLKSWHANGLAERVVSRIMEILKAPDMHTAHPRIIFTGHSLGGALATLAAYDVAAQMQAEHIEAHVTVYTFGQPRVGNHAFAEDYTLMVPDAWSIINDQDIVSRGAKFLVLYKRGGQRVIINALGDMIVRPTPLEVSLQLTPGGGSVSQHYLGSYQRSVLAVLLSQFSRKAFRGGISGVHRLARVSLPVQVLLREGANLEMADIGRLERWGANYVHRLKPEISADLSKGKAVSVPRGSGSANLLGGQPSLTQPSSPSFANPMLPKPGSSGRESDRIPEEKCGEDEEVGKSGS